MELSFPSATIRSVTRRMEVQLFAEGGPLLGCEPLDPRGHAPGTAAERTHMAPDYALSGPPGDPLELADVRTGQYLLVVDAFGPPCESVVSATLGGETSCARLANADSTVLRGHACERLDLGSSNTVRVNLEPLAEIGATLRVPPEIASRFGDEAPLFLVDGEAGIGDLVVQVLDANASEVTGVPIHFSVPDGSATFLQAMPIPTGPDAPSDAKGVARATVRAGLSASQAGPIRIYAHAAGYEGSPIEFAARAVPEVLVEASEVPAPPEVDLQQVDVDYATLVVRDLDGDGWLDFLTHNGSQDHRLIVGYGQASGDFTVAASAVRPQALRALTVARLAPGRRTVVASVVDRSGAYNDQRRTYVVTNPGYELWSELDQQPSGPTLSGATTLITELNGAPMEKMTIAFESADLDGDGIDELAASRCSYLLRLLDGQENPVICFGGVNDDGDSEIMVLRVGATPEILVPQAVRPVEANDGGFRETHFGDINGDGSLDLAFVSSSEMKGVCGNRNKVPGFDFDTSPRFDESIIFGNGYSFAFGQFDDRPGDDVVAAGPFRAGSPVSGLTVLPSAGCAFESTPAVLAGRRTGTERLLIRTADLNGDGYSDILLLQRDEARLRLYFGAGQGRLAEGPTLPVPGLNIGAFDVGVETRDGRAQPVAVVALLAENRFWVLRFRPSP